MMKKKTNKSPDTWKLVMFSILSCLSFSDTFSYAFLADICVTLEAVSMAGSVKENCYNNMSLLTVVTGKCFSSAELAFSSPV